jgi:hypothetical protein
MEGIRKKADMAQDESPAVPETAEAMPKTAKPKVKKRKVMKPKVTKKPVDDTQAKEIAELKKMVGALLQKSETMENIMEAREIESQELRQTIYQLEQGLNEREATGEVIEREGEIVYDPYSVQNPFTIKTEIPPNQDFPDGQILGWKSPSYRKKRGWRGWIPIEHGDHYAGDNDEFLSTYIPDPPERMIGPDAIDNYVRRADMVLARLSKPIAEARARKRELLAKRKRLAAQAGGTEVLRDGVEIVGEGATPAKNPRREFGIAAPIPKREDGRDAFRTSLPITRDKSQE